MHQGSSSAGDMKRNTITLLITVSPFTDLPCRLVELWVARGLSQQLGLRQSRPRSRPASLRSPCVGGPTSTEPPGGGELITALSLMNYEYGLISKDCSSDLCLPLTSTSMSPVYQHCKGEKKMPHSILGRLFLLSC